MGNNNIAKRDNNEFQTTTINNETNNSEVDIIKEQIDEVSSITDDLLTAKNIYENIILTEYLAINNVELQSLPADHMRIHINNNYDKEIENYMYTIKDENFNIKVEHNNKELDPATRIFEEIKTIIAEIKTKCCKSNNLPSGYFSITEKDREEFAKLDNQEVVQSLTNIKNVVKYVIFKIVSMQNFVDIIQKENYIKNTDVNIVSHSKVFNEASRCLHDLSSEGFMEILPLKSQLEELCKNSSNNVISEVNFEIYVLSQKYIQFIGYIYEKIKEYCETS